MLDSGEVEPAVGGGQRSRCKPPPTQDETRVRKSRTGSPTPLRKAKDPRKVQTIERTDAKLQRRLVSAARVVPAGAGSGRPGDGNTSHRVFCDRP